MKAKCINFLSHCNILDSIALSTAFFSFLQLYYWQIRTPFDQTEDRLFPREVEEIYDDVLKEVRPNLNGAKSLEEAADSVKVLEAKILSSIQAKAPEIYAQTNAYNEENRLQNQRQQNNSGHLGTVH